MNKYFAFVTSFILGLMLAASLTGRESVNPPEPSIALTAPAPMTQLAASN